MITPTQADPDSDSATDSDEDQRDADQRDDDAARSGVEPRGRRDVRTLLTRATALIVLPLLAFGIAGTAGYFKYRAGVAHAAEVAGIEASAAAREITLTMLSYAPDTAEQTLSDARIRLTGTFRDEYTQLMNDVVIPGAKAGGVTTVVAVPASAVVSAEPDRVVVLLYVNQHVIAAGVPASDNATSVRVVLERVGPHWLVAEFAPI